MTVHSTNVGFVVDIMDTDTQLAVVRALERIYESVNLNEIWPAAIDAKNKAGVEISLKDVELVVVPLDRIGAPAGASGVSVYVIYFSHRENNNAQRVPPSPPLVVKVGETKKLSSEMEFIKHWPALSTEVKHQFALPLCIDKEAQDIAVLIAPFRSQAKSNPDGTRLDIKLKDLWALLHKTEELQATQESGYWSDITRYIEHALDGVAHVHKNNRTAPSRRDASYKVAYKWYLRNTIVLENCNNESSRSHIPKLLFGDERKIVAFGRKWPNPTLVIQKLIQPEVCFNGVFGPVHGDLHPKNIVIGRNDTVHIIDFGWAQNNVHVIVDYLLLDINLRGTTLPSQIPEPELLKMAEILTPEQEFEDLHPLLRPRAKIIEEVIWKRISENNLVKDWHTEYLIPFFFVSYGLLVHLDAVRNQPAMIASVLAAAHLIESHNG